MIRDGLPRKVTIGTCWMRTGKVYPSREHRLDRLVSLVDEMASRAEAAGRQLDVACLPEDANTAGWQGELAERAEPLPAGQGGDAAGEAAGPTLARMAEAAQRHGCYVIIPHFVRAGGRYHNSAVLLDRSGEILGRYDKLHGIEWPEGSGRVEHCCTPGLRAPVWDLDFGRAGIQICFDLLYDDGWAALERRGAEIIFWPSAYPGVQHLCSKAWQHGYYVVSSPWRPPCGIHDPTGHVMASADEACGQVLVETIDLEYRLMPWKSAKDRGAALKKAYGERISLFYRGREDVWFFWSNDAEHPVERILRDNRLEPLGAYVERMRRVQDACRGGPPLV